MEKLKLIYDEGCFEIWKRPFEYQVYVKDKKGKKLLDIALTMWGVKRILKRFSEINRVFTYKTQLQEVQSR